MEFRILGPVEIWRDGQRDPLDGSKQRTVLAALLLAQGRMISDSRLSELLWGADPPTTLNAQIYTYVSRLRKLVSPDSRIERQRPGYLLRLDSARFDFADFGRLSQLGRRALDDGRHSEAARALTDALALWRGPALANVTDYLAEVELPALEEARMAALESRIQADLALGRHGPLIAELTGLVAAYPLRERLRAELMTALHRCARQADALAVYQEGRRVLAEELGVDPSPMLYQAYQDVLAGDSAALAGAAATGAAGIGAAGIGATGTGAVRPTVAVATPVSGRTGAASGGSAGAQPPAMAPPDIADFTARSGQLEQLCRLLDPAPGGAPGNPAILVTGMPGVGKTALAVRAAHRCGHRYPDGRLYVDLAEVDVPEAAVAGEVAGRLLRGLGLPAEAIPLDPAERIQVYRRELGHRRVLIVLDNASGAEQVRGLLSGGAGCAVIITSRTHLTQLDAVHLIDLGPLEPAEAVAMLTAIVGADRVATEPEVATRLVRLCGHLPLAVRLVGARLNSRPHWTLARLAHRMASGGRRLDELRLGDIDVRASLAASYQCLPPAARAALRRLALLEVADFPAWLAAAVLDATAAAGEDLVDALVDARLLDVGRIDGQGQLRYRFHELVRLVARERALAEDCPTERGAALDRAFGAWLAFAVEVDRRLPDRCGGWSSGAAARWPLPTGLVDELASAPLGWFEAEREVLLALIDQAAASGRVAHAWELARALATFLRLTGRYDDWRRTHQRACAAARAAGDQQGQAAMLLGLADLSSALDDCGARLSYGDQAARLLRQIDDPTGLADALCHRGDAYRQTGHHDLALESLRQGLAMAVDAGYRAGHARAQEAIGRVLHERGDLTGAAEALGHAEAIWRDLCNRRQLVAVLRAAAAVDHDAGRRPTEDGRLEECLSIVDELADPVTEAYTLNLLGDLYQVDRPEYARQLYSQAIAKLTAAGLEHRYGHAVALLGLGKLALLDGSADEAVEVLNTARDSWRALGMPVGEARTLRAISDAELARGDLEAAGHAWRVAMELFAWMRLPRDTGAQIRTAVAF